MSNLQTYYHFELDFQKLDQHTGGKWWLIHGTKRRKDNQLQNPCHNEITTAHHSILQNIITWAYVYYILTHSCIQSEIYENL